MMSNLLKTLKAMVQGPTEALEHIGTLTMAIKCCETIETDLGMGAPFYLVIDIVKDLCGHVNDFKEVIT